MRKLGSFPAQHTVASTGDLNLAKSKSTDSTRTTLSDLLVASMALCRVLDDRATGDHVLNALRSLHGETFVPDSEDGWSADGHA